MSAKTLQLAANRSPSEFYQQLTRELAALDRDAKAYAYKVCPEARGYTGDRPNAQEVKHLRMLLGSLSSCLTGAVQAVHGLESVVTGLEHKRQASATAPVSRAARVEAAEAEAALSPGKVGA